MDAGARGVAHGVEAVAERAGGRERPAELFEPARQGHGGLQQQAGGLLLATARASPPHQEQEDHGRCQPWPAAGQGWFGRSDSAWRRRQAGEVAQVGRALGEEAAGGLAQQFLVPAVGIQIRLDRRQDGGRKFGQPVDFAQKVVPVRIHR